MDWELALDLIHGYLLKYSEVDPPHTYFSTAHSTVLYTVHLEDDSRQVITWFLLFLFCKNKGKAGFLYSCRANK